MLCLMCIAYKMLLTIICLFRCDVVVLFISVFSPLSLSFDRRRRRRYHNFHVYQNTSVY